MIARGGLSHLCVVHSEAGGLGLSEKAISASHGKQINKQLASMVPTSASS